ncbi:hypothetical protein F5B19DRAFT_494372 [Rostrohypoxylon terebratum]|nr:hypothetical protein F5B19DRAFT_494372 [Rostrohypoxylon terebratum]
MRPESILPIKHTRYIGTGSCAVIDKATIHRNYVEYGSEIKYNNSTICALKVFVSSQSKHYYEAEIRAFKRLANDRDRPESIIKLLGGVNIGDAYTLLLEWHQNIKPSKILVQGSQTGIIFKLADLGLGPFRTISSCAEDILDWDSFETHIYGAPEKLIDKTFPDEAESEFGQIADVWSLGCIYSEVAISNMRHDRVC